MTKITIPYMFTPRQYQLELFKAMDSGKKRALVVWSRRAGKDKCCINYMIKEMFRRVGVYYYFFPTYEQGRKAMWEGIDDDGFKILDHFPPGTVKRQLNQTMMIELNNGSVFRIVAADSVEKSIVGTNPVGMVFSEYSIQDPAGWQLMSPVAQHNDGWVIFNGTPRGRNHMYNLDININKSQSDDWFYSKKTVEELGVYSDKWIAKMLESERIIGKTSEEIRQEYYCDYAAGVKGAFYADQVEQARKESRIGSYIYDDNLKVDTFWDLGVDDDTVIWFRQLDGNRIVWFDYYASSGKPISHYVKVLEEKGYNYRTHYLPHDGANRTVQTGMSTQDIFEGQLREAGMEDDVVVAPRLPLQDGINAVRSRFSRFHFDEVNCEEGLKALDAYHRKYDQRKNSFMAHPVHDWSSHAADAIRTEALAEEWNDPFEEINNIRVDNDFDPFD